MTDPISDMLTRIRNAQIARHSEVEMPFSKLKQAVAKILNAEHYLRSVDEKEEGGKKSLVLTLAYQENGTPAIKDIRRISRPGRRVYRKKGELPKVLSGYGIALVSTPEGLMTNREAAKKGLGGEIICEVF